MAEHRGDDTMKYQFQIDGRAGADVRDTWWEAAQDAVSAGYASWTGHDEIKRDDQCEIARIPEEKWIGPRRFGLPPEPPKVDVGGVSEDAFFIVYFILGLLLGIAIGVAI
jgi:hypothetical protein